MKADALHAILSEHAKVDTNQLDMLYAQLPEDATVAQYRALIIKSGLLKYNDIMTLFITKGLVPKGQNFVDRIATEREKTRSQTPLKHDPKLAGDDLTVNLEVDITNGKLPIEIPTPNSSDLHFNSSDEKQAVLLALDMAKHGDPAEAEVILLETIESFENSLAAMQCLCWLYLATGHADLILGWARRNLDKNQSDTLTLELLSIAEQILGKHLLATARYQRLLQKDKVKSSWYFMLARAQEESQCTQEAIENYKIYLAIGKDPKQRDYAQSRLEELSRK
ncbi:hypothetical protein QWZ13_17080 [Reinekea marina]|uniref:Tetratricopeptide repeat protein n=1 Tax=Reinekea marina TaxID=1310421 RepID=A0ABV7WS73_9GAMM|nr:hypothetical protein [Reinekea marina]MDN3650621.1 hypothetical protein [Reinekea marina]